MSSSGPFQHNQQAATTTGYAIDCSAGGGLGQVTVFARVACWVKLSPTASDTAPAATPAPGAGNAAVGWTHLAANERLDWDGNAGIFAPDEPKRSSLKVQTLLYWCEAAAGEIQAVGN